MDHWRNQTENETHLETNENNHDSKPIGMAKAVLREKFISNRIISQKTRKISNKQPNLTPKAIRERRTNKSQISKRKETIKIRAEINEIETKETMEKIITNEAAHKGLISRIYKQFMQLKIRKTTQ